MLGIGVLWEPMATMMGIIRKNILKAMHEHVEDMKTVDVDGEFVKLHNVHLSKAPISIPIYIGATGFNMMELASEIADGVLLNYLVSPTYNKQALKFLSKGAAKVGRKSTDLDRPQLVACPIYEDADRAIDAGRRVVTEYLFLEPHIMKASGIKTDVLEAIHKTLGSWPPRADNFQEALTLVDDDLVRSVCAAGTSEDCKQKVREYVAAGCTCPLICPISGSVESMIETFSNGY
jgi:5,10-methylenetetrahydromethanopterin reductase